MIQLKKDWKITKFLDQFFDGKLFRLAFGIKEIFPSTCWCSYVIGNRTQRAEHLYSLGSCSFLKAIKTNQESSHNAFINEGKQEECLFNYSEVRNDQNCWELEQSGRNHMFWEHASLKEWKWKTFSQQVSCETHAKHFSPASTKLSPLCLRQTAYMHSTIPRTSQDSHFCELTHMCELSTRVN